MFGFGDSMDVVHVKNMNAVVLAYVGDAVYTLYVRKKLALSSDGKAAELERRATDLVRAESQARLIATLLPHLTEEEEGVYRRARNAKKNTRAKHATVGEYSMSTGFEALVGFLYLTGRIERLNELLEIENTVGEL